MFFPLNGGADEEGKENDYPRRRRQNSQPPIVICVNLNIFGGFFFIFTSTSYDKGTIFFFFRFDCVFLKVVVCVRPSVQTCFQTLKI